MSSLKFRSYEPFDEGLKIFQVAPVDTSSLDEAIAEEIASLIAISKSSNLFASILPKSQNADLERWFDRRARIAKQRTELVLRIFAKKNAEAAASQVSASLSKS